MIKTLRTGFISLCLFTGLCLQAVSADNLQQAIPEPLKPWTSWVLRDQPEIQCPQLYNASQYFCAYPSSLDLRLQGDGGRFQQSWRVYGRSWIQLPGNPDHWPLQVVSNNKRIPVINKDGQPAIELDPGQYTVSGRFSWQQMPKSLQLPTHTGLVYVTLNGESLAQPDIRNGRLWLQSTQSIGHANNRLSLTVSRKISDRQPLLMTTLIEMDVAGLQREIQLDGALLERFTVSGLRSPLPARIDRQGRLRLQLRPGHWQVYVDSLINEPVTAIQLSDFDAPWPEQEIWAFEHQPQLRQLQISDKTTIDPQQTPLPAEWKQFPSYAMAAGERLQWSVTRRGNPQPEPDQLELKKHLWLDFSGDAFTVKDDISGSLSRQWRLNVSPEVALGQVTVDGQPQTITRLDDSAAAGVELRQGQLQLSADSRIDYQGGQLSASGWQSHFNRVSASLNLPMGYQLFSLSGAHAPEAWLNRWSLLDLFLVLITAIACYRLWGIGWGLLALATLTLIWHEADAPQLIWLNMIITLALIRALSDGKLKKMLSLYRNLVMLLLVLSSLVFVILQARTAVYPQLEAHDYAPAPLPVASVQTEPVPEQMAEKMARQPASASVEEARSYSKIHMDSSVDPSVGLVKSGAPARIQMVDPDAMIQTGPGLPDWHWHSYSIHWDGPVQQSQSIDMTLISPGLHRLLNLLRILLVLGLLWRLFDISRGGGKHWRDYLPNGASAPAVSPLLAPLLAPLLGLSLVTALPEARAEYPSPQLLDDLKKHLSQPAKCLPRCASLESLHIDLNADRLQLTLKAHAAEQVAVPLPVPVHKWQPQRVQVDAKPARALFRRGDDSLWLVLQPGVHELRISGSVSRLAELKIDFQLKPQHISYSLQGWSADISGEQLKQARSLGFHRLASTRQSASPSLASNDIPVFAEVSRQLELGLDWYVSTRVRLTAGNALPSILQIPLLAGESVITEGINVKDNRAVVTLNQNTRSVSWRSTLPRTDVLRLKAAETGAFNEVWRLSASTIWHIDTDGIPVIYHQRQGQQWQPEWQPWPGESVQIRVSRPQSIAGNTRTIDHSKLLMTPGESLTHASLDFSLRSSQGGQHSIQIPADSELLSVSINDEAIPARIDDGGIDLPISPGKQNIGIEWREPRGIDTGLYRSSAVILGAESVNATISIKPGQRRWVLFAGGPALGPAVLFWGIFLVILAIAFGLSRIKDMPLNLWHWLLLGIGLSASAPAAGVLIVGWLLALRTRGRMQSLEHSGLFNGFQLLLAALTALSLLTLFFVIQQGLLGSPDMQITGNQSTRYLLNWYSDRSDADLPVAWIISVPLMVYRILMLLWAIWLAFALLRWLRWGWDCYTQGGYWREWHWAHEKKQDKSGTAEDE